MGKTVFNDIKVTDARFLFARRSGDTEESYDLDRNSGIFRGMRKETVSNKGEFLHGTEASCEIQAKPKF